jgi:hypothetical protein
VCLACGWCVAAARTTAADTTHNSQHMVTNHLASHTAQLTEGVMEAVWLHMVTMMNSTPMVLGAYPTSPAVVVPATPRGGLVVETIVAL